MKLFEPVVQRNPMVSDVIHKGFNRRLAELRGPSQRDFILSKQFQRNQLGRFLRNASSLATVMRSTGNST